MSLSASNDSFTGPVHKEWTSEEIDIYLSKLSDKLWENRFPVTLYLTLLILSGVAGNSLVVVAYLRFYDQGVFRVFALTMGFCDLITNVIALPLQMVNLRYTFNPFSLPLCRSLYVFSTLPSHASGIVHILVALDRVHRMFLPFKRQLKRSEAWKLVCACTGFYSIVFLLFTPIHGLYTMPTSVPGVRAVTCWVQDEFRNTWYVTAYKVVLGVEVLLGTLLLCSAYIALALRIWRGVGIMIPVNDNDALIKLFSSAINSIQKEEDQGIYTSSAKTTYAKTSSLSPDAGGNKDSSYEEGHISNQVLSMEKEVGTQNVMTAGDILPKKLTGVHIPDSKTPVGSLGKLHHNIFRHISIKPTPLLSSITRPARKSRLLNWYRNSISSLEITPFKTTFPSLTPMSTTDSSSSKMQIPKQKEGSATDHVEFVLLKEFQRRKKISSVILKKIRMQMIVMCLLAIFYVINWVPYLITRQVHLVWTGKG